MKSGFLHHLSIDLLILLSVQGMAESVFIKPMSMKQAVPFQMLKRWKRVIVLKESPRRKQLSSLRITQNHKTVNRVNKISVVDTEKWQYGRQC